MSAGKKAGADLELGLATAPVLFASREFPALNTLINRSVCTLLERFIRHQVTLCYKDVTSGALLNKILLVTNGTHMNKCYTGRKLCLAATLVDSCGWQQHW